MIAEAAIAFDPDTLQLTISSNKPLPRVSAVNKIQNDILESRREQPGAQVP